MITIEINGKEYKAFDKWVDINLQRFIDLCNLEMPVKLKELYLQTNKPDEYSKIFDTIDYSDNTIEFPKYYGKAIEIMTDIPSDIIELMNWEQRDTIYHVFIYPIVLSALFSIPMEKKGSDIIESKLTDKESFIYKGVEYYYPKTLRIDDIEIPMAGEPIITFTESSDIIGLWVDMAKKGIENIALFVSIYCRPYQEEYNQNEAIRRSKIFKHLTMDIFWKVFFCTKELTNGLMTSIPQHLEALVHRKIKKQQVQAGLIRLEVGG